MKLMDIKKINAISRSNICQINNNNFAEKFVDNNLQSLFLGWIHHLSLAELSSVMPTVNTWPTLGVPLKTSWSKGGQNIFMNIFTINL